MSGFRTFEEMESWQKAREVTREIYKLAKQDAFSADALLRDQIRRTSVGMMSKIAEGFEKDQSREFVRYLAAAKGLAGEVKTQLYVALDQGYISLENFKYIGGKLYEVTSLLSSLINYVRASELDEHVTSESLGQTRLFEP